MRTARLRGNRDLNENAGFTVRLIVKPTDQTVQWNSLRDFLMAKFGPNSIKRIPVFIVEQCRRQRYSLRRNPVVKLNYRSRLTNTRFHRRSLISSRAFAIGLLRHNRKPTDGNNIALNWALRIPCAPHSYQLISSLPLLLPSISSSFTIHSSAYIHSIWVALRCLLIGIGSKELTII